MATITKARTRVAYTISGNSPEVRYAAESAGKTFKSGAVLAFTASSRLAAVLGTSNPTKADFGKGIAGLAVKDAGNLTVSTTLVPYYVANQDTVFVGNVVSRTSVATATLALSYIGSAMAGSFNSSAMFVCIKGIAATNSVCMVRGYFEGDTTGDTNGRVYFQFIKAATAFH